MENTKPHPERGLFAWALYDWANSAFPTVIITFVFSAYFTKAVAVGPEIGTSQWAWAMSISALFVAFLGPLLGSVADSSGRRKPWLATLTVLCVGATALLWFTEAAPSWTLWALVFAAIANFAFETSLIFYNAMLADLAPPHRIGRWSGWAWGLGYAGGLAALALCLPLVMIQGPIFGLDPESKENIRIAAPLVALWLALFSLPLFLFTPDRAATGIRPLEAVRRGAAALFQTIRNAGEYRQTIRFLLAHIIYTNGLNTIFIFGGIYAAVTFGMDFSELLIFGIAMNVTAGLGAFCFAWGDDYFGAKRVIIVSIIGLFFLGGALLVVEGKTMFWIFGLPLGIFVGPIQAASRSMMARLAPPKMRTEMFGLYAFSGKATAFLGPALFGWATMAFNSPRAGMATILVFFAVGLAVLLPLKEPNRGNL